MNFLRYKSGWVNASTSKIILSRFSSQVENDFKKRRQVPPGFDSFANVRRQHLYQQLEIAGRICGMIQFVFPHSYSRLMLGRLRGHPPGPALPSCASRGCRRGCHTSRPPVPLAVHGSTTKTPEPSILSSLRLSSAWLASRSGKVFTPA